jgi:hypothetical protein
MVESDSVQNLILLYLIFYIFIVTSCSGRPRRRNRRGGFGGVILRGTEGLQNQNQLINDDTPPTNRRNNRSNIVTPDRSFSNL